MNTRILFKQLRLLQIAMSWHENINCGGCGIFAYLVAEKLQNLGLDVEIVTPVDSWSVAANRVRHRIKNPVDAHEWSDNGLSRAHLAVRFKTKTGNIYTYDSETLYKGGSLFGKRLYRTNRRFGTGLTIKETKAMCKRVEGWNREFNRTEVPEIRRKINQFLGA